MLDFLCIFVHGRMRAHVVVLIPGASRDGVAGSKLNNGHLCIWVRGGCGLGICSPSSGHKGGINNYNGWLTWVQPGDGRF